MLPHKQIEQRLQAAVKVVLPDADLGGVLVRPCPDPKFGDYQTTSLMALAKTRKMNPRQVATDVLAKLDVADICEKVDIAGAGFLNFRLKPEALVNALSSAARGEHLFFEKTTQPKTIVVDYSSPNVAKPMHVGHIRSTGIGDALQRVMRLLGHRVITDNHIGDWGTQFGMLLLAWKRDLDPEALKRDAIAELERIYKGIQAEIKQQTKAWLEDHYGNELKAFMAQGLNEEDATKKVIAAIPADQLLNISATETASRQELVKLQSGDSENLVIWREMGRLSQEQFDSIYSRLGVRFDYTLGESFYNPELAGIVKDLLDRGIARESEGAVGIFSDGSLPPKDDPFLVFRDDKWQAEPALIRKTDGGFNYTTTDLATLDYRMKTWSPTEILYVVDDRQSPHFKKLFLAFARSHPEAARKVKLVHVSFGKIMGEDGKPFKTRAGDTVKLGELLDEAEERAFKIVTDKSPALPEEQRKAIARVVGLGSVKYADLLPNRQSDYVFSWEKMLALNGNTAPYLQYAYARIRSIFRKADVGQASRLSLTSSANMETGGTPVLLVAPQEIALAKHLLNLGLTLEAVAEEYRPNFLCNYLYELAGKFTSFYENCPVLKAETPEIRASRLALSELTARVLKEGLNALGIEVLEQM